MFWGGFGFSGKTTLGEISTRIDSAGYQGLLQDHLELNVVAGGGYFNKTTQVFTLPVPQWIGSTARRSEL